jgi:two-component system alkaline phosphatase synthesis response regulator PhoP
MMHRKVLLVDDEQSILRICSLYLKAEGMIVTALQDANTIVDVVRAENPDVIVLDLNLPGTDGFAAVQNLKKAAETAKIPILILSGRASIEDKKTALLLCGADDYMTKPFDPDELVTRISVLHRRYKGLVFSCN